MIFDFSSSREAQLKSRELAMAVTAAENRILCRILGRLMMFVDARDMSMMPDLAMTGMHKPHLTELICQQVKPGMTCVDVGACFGYHSLLLSELVGQHGRVFAYEPNKRVFLMLKHNIEINKYFPRAIAFPDAVGAADGKGKLCVHKRRYGGATLSEQAKASFGKVSSDEPEQDVEIASLDSRLGSKGIHPDFFIISTVGYEPQVWAGMKTLVRAKRKISILMDFTPRWYENAGAFVADMLDHGLMASRIHENGELEPLSSPDQFTKAFHSDLLLTT